MRCETVRENLPDHILGVLPEDQGLALRTHLRGCGPCRTEASALDQGVAMFATATHVAQPPGELRDRVMTVLAEEWAEDQPARIPRPRKGFLVPRLAIAAAAVVLVGALAWGAVAQTVANDRRGDAAAYREILETLGGRDMRATTLVPELDGVEGSAVAYDSHQGLSWVGVFVRAPGYSGSITVAIATPGGRTIEFGFPIEIDAEGRGVTWLDTAADLSRFTVLTLTGADGRTVATGTFEPGDG